MTLKTHSNYLNISFWQPQLSKGADPVSEDTEDAVVRKRQERNYVDCIKIWKGCLSTKS